MRIDKPLGAFIFARKVQPTHEDDAMTKDEFDRMSMDAGFSPCADYMWPEVEQVYSTSDLIDKDLVVDIYWHEPGIHREILALRREIARMGRECGTVCDGYRGFNEMWKLSEQMGKLHARFMEVIDAARARKRDRDVVKQERKG